MAGDPHPIEPISVNAPDTRPRGAAVVGLDALAAAVPVLLWGASLDGRTTALGPAWARYTGRPLDELLGDGWTRAVHPEDLERCLGIRRTSFDALSRYTMDLRLRRHDGEYRWMADAGQPHHTADGAVAGFAGALIDIHERKALEETLAERTQALRLAERRQGQFLARLSHELRNPLAPIANAASVLRTLEQTSPILVRLREILERQVGKLGRLVEELIDVTRAAQGQVSLVRERISVESIVQAAVASSHEVINAGGHRLDVDLPEQRLSVRGDITRLAQALANLIGNAAKFTPRPGIVTIAVRSAAKTVQISVKDQGQGIAPEFLAHAFELFAQQDQSLARTLGGLGVGLTLARRIAQLHGGDVEALSDGPGQGAEFVLWLPLLQVEEEAARQSPPRLTESYRVLIVEDDADALESLRLQMELWGNDVSTARSAEEALAGAEAIQPQIVLCDIGLPEMDGLRLVEALRRKLNRAPVVFAAVTGYAGPQDQERALAAGFDSFLVKPLDADSLARLLIAYSNRAA